MKTIKSLYNAIASRPTRSHWEKAVKSDALTLVDNLADIVDNPNDMRLSAKGLECALLNGATNWHQYSCSGCALINDRDIAEHYCAPSELKKVTRADGGLRWMANAWENWLDVQARALTQAAIIIINTYYEL